MDVDLQKFELVKVINPVPKKKKMNDIEIDEKYEKGEMRIVTEQGAFKLDLITAIFTQKKYNLKPEFQRRITWDTKKRSKLIESFIMNIPVPPVFLYEDDFSSYVVMDGLQRISTIIDFYNDHYALVGLEEWSELNGKKYSDLPKKVKEGIDRRQISVITLLKESADDSITAEKMKKMVFERLNTGGVQLEDQEIRNALYSGKFNNFCFEMSKNDIFRKLWGISDFCGVENVEDEEDEMSLDEEVSLMAAKNKMYRRMYDVELVLRYFAMRNVDNYSGKLSKFLDAYLLKANNYSDDEIQKEMSIFEETINKADMLFGEKAFCIYREGKGWSQPQNMVYDAIMLGLSTKTILCNKLNKNVVNNIDILKQFYIDNEGMFNGKKQSKSDIVKRAEALRNTIITTMLQGR